MFNDEVLTSVLDVIHLTSSGDSTMLIGIDGLAGSGKSTLAMQLNERLLESAIVCVDDFYVTMLSSNMERLNPERDYIAYFDWKRLRDAVLEPLSKGIQARYRHYDWSTNTYGEWLAVEPGRIVFVEGVYSTRPELRPYFSLTLYIETPRDIRLSRIINRRYKDLSWIDRWMAVEDWYQEHEHPSRHADLVLQGD